MPGSTVTSTPLELEATIGFSGATLRASISCEGQVPNGLKLHPDGKHLIYPLGSTVVVKDQTAVKPQAFLNGHTNLISAVAVSRSGKYIASGQVSYMGLQVPC